MLMLHSLVDGENMQSSLASLPAEEEFGFSPLQILFQSAGLSVSVKRIGQQQTPIVVCELSSGLSAYLINQASSYRPDWSQASTIYPGVWSQVPQGFEDALLAFIQPLITRYYFPRKAQRAVSCYAMATTEKDRLQVGQRMPHFDSFDPYQLASVLYLCDESFGGTGFFRHNSTGIEKVTRSNCSEFTRVVADEVVEFGPPDAEYTGQCGHLFDKLFECQASVGRLVLYPSALLHAGLVNSEKNTERDPKRGRLTITSFIKC